MSRFKNIGVGLIAMGLCAAGWALAEQQVAPGTYGAQDYRYQPGYGPQFRPYPYHRPMPPRPPMYPRGAYMPGFAPAYAPGYPMQPPMMHGAATAADDRGRSSAADTAAAAAARAPKDVDANQSGTVSIQGMRFNPPRITVKKGATVTWTQRDAMPHTVTASDGSFESKRLSANTQYSRTFDQPGTYPYYCGIHPSMQGEVVVD